MYTHASSRLFSWSTELLAFASRLFAPEILDHLLTTCVCHSKPFFLLRERSGRNRPLREAPCITNTIIDFEFVESRRLRHSYRDRGFPKIVSAPTKIHARRQEMCVGFCWVTVIAAEAVAIRATLFRHVCMRGHLQHLCFTAAVDWKR